MPYDLVVKGGTLIDPARSINDQRDVAFADSRVAAVAREIPVEAARSSYDARGKIVVPGLVDIHTHCYYGVLSVCVDPRKDFLPTGVTCAIDGGTAGSANYYNLRDLIIKPGVLHLYAFLNIEVLGLIAVGYLNGDPRDVALVDRAVRLVERNRDTILGLKLRLPGADASAEILTGLLDRTLEAATRARTRIMCHVGGFPDDFSWRTLVERLRPGDIITHCFQPGEPTVIGSDGKVRGELREAAAKGIVLDTGGHLASWKVAEEAAADGVWPDTISTDDFMLRGTPRYTMTDTMSKFLALGMPLFQVVDAATRRPADAIGLGERHGSLAVGACGDAAIIERRSGQFPYDEVGGRPRILAERLTPIATVKSGRVAWAGG